jgi:ubiquinone/menaquinone biosynthesis C-methylase UbiE
MTDRGPNATLQVRNLFDAKAATWPSKYVPGGRLTGRLTRLAGAVAYHVPAGGSVLDLGCGTGELAVTIAAAGMQTTGCDISPKMLHRAAAADPSGAADWVQLDPGWRRLPFASGAFDAVVAASVLEYVDDPTAVLRECCRVLRPGGVILCTVPNPRHPVRWLEWLLGVARRVPVVRTSGPHWPKLDGYLTYLRISRQRHSRQWWHSAAARAGLLDVRYRGDSAERSPLRLLTFQRA